MKTVHKSLSGDVDEYFVAAIRVECGVTSIQSLGCMALDINFLTRRGVDPNPMLIGTLVQDFVLQFKRVMLNMVATKAITYSVELINLPHNTQPNTTITITT